MTDKEAPPDERAKFEAAMRPIFPLWTFQSDGVGGYHNHATEAARIAWETRAASSSLPLPSDPLPEYFMDGVDFQHHLDDDSHGTRVYADLEDLRDRRRCVAQCGIVAVHVTLSRWVQRQDFDAVVPAAESPGQQEKAVLSDLSDEQIAAVLRAAQIISDKTESQDWLLVGEGSVGVRIDLRAAIAAIRSRLEPKP